MATALRLFAAASSLLLPLAACSLLVDTSGLAGAGGAPGVADTGVADAAGDAAGLTDAALLGDGASTADGGDAAAESGDGGDASAPPCMPSATTLCDSFDDSTPGSTWTSRETTRGTITFDAVGLSLPHAFEATIVAGSGAGSANLIQTYGSPRTNIRCDFDLKLKDVPATGEIDVLDLITSVPGGPYHVYFACFAGQWAVAEFQGGGADGGTALDRSTPLGGLPADTWFHVVFEQTGASAKLTANGTTVTLGSLTLPAGTDTSVTIGVTYASKEVQSADVVIDNVACTVLP